MSLLRRMNNRRGRPLRRRGGGLNFGFRKAKKKDKETGMRYERLVEWAKEEWQRRYGDAPYMTIWASSECSNKIAQDIIKTGRRLRGKTRYAGFEQLDAEVIVPISDYTLRGRKMVLTSSAGAFIFQFEDEETGERFEVVYASSYVDDDVQDLTAVALVPEGRLDAWANFEGICSRVVRPRIRRRRDVYVIGGTEAFFDPTVDWKDVILDTELKDAIMGDVEAFFNEGVDIYRKLKLTPFRKLLMAGVPGTGKTMLCAALAKHAISQRRIVVYVSGSDRDGATFEKMQRAFQAVASASLPTLLIVEEIDAYLRGEDKARILNVLDGFESPNNAKGTLMLATTNYPEAIDDRVFKRPGRLDRIFVVPTIQDAEIAAKMLKHYMAEQWQPEHAEIAPKLTSQPGAFVREVAVHARMLAAHERKTEVSLALLQSSVDSLLRQMKMDGSFLEQRRPLGIGGNTKRRSNYEDEF